MTIKTEYEIRTKIAELEEDLRYADLPKKNNKYKTFSDLRHAHSQLDTLKWVLGDKKMKWRMK